MGKNSDQANPLFADDPKEAQRIKDTNAAETGSEVDAVDRSKSAESRCNACGSCDGNGRHAPTSSVLTGSSGGKAWPAALALPASAHGAEPSDLAHELWAAAQLAPGEGIADSVSRIEAIQRRARRAEPSDAEINLLAESILNRGERLDATLRVFGRAVLASWGAPPLPVAPAAQAGAVPEGCNHDWQPFYTRVTQTHVICARCDLKQPAPAQPAAARLEKIRQAIRDYHYALDKRLHGGVAQSAAYRAIESAMEMPWIQGAEAAARAAAVPATPSTGEPTT